MKAILVDPSLDERWDQFVESHPYGWVCHLSGWKRALEAAFPHMRGHYLALVDDSGEIQAGLPLFEVRSPITGNRLVSIPFATLCDPLVQTRVQWDILLEKAKELAKRTKVAWMEIRAYRNTAFLNDSNLTPYMRFKNHYLLLNKPTEELFRSFHPSTVRYMIKKASKLPCEIKEADIEEEVQSFYRLYTITRKRLGLPPQPLRFFFLWRELGAENIKFLLALLSGKPIAALMLLVFKERASWEAVGLVDEARSSGIGYLLVWEAIKKAHIEGKKIFDFGRTTVENQGLMAFKSRWGTQVMDLPQFYWPEKRPTQRERLMDHWESRMRKICSKFPTPIFRALGSLCYKHMG
uniref:GNAT family N-acetyltransferase n=1 Tax=candidate division CPR3 bacterium TaxID=2268181 RepID=A0A7V3JAN7_UNCC3